MCERRIVDFDQLSRMNGGRVYPRVMWSRKERALSLAAFLFVCAVLLMALWTTVGAFIGF